MWSWKECTDFRCEILFNFILYGEINFSDQIMLDFIALYPFLLQSEVIQVRLYCLFELRKWLKLVIMKFCLDDCECIWKLLWESNSPPKRFLGILSDGTWYTTSSPHEEKRKIFTIYPKEMRSWNYFVLNWECIYINNTNDFRQRCQNHI
jgi:hypothetical protein